jgi:hypothetical protein
MPPVAILIAKRQHGSRAPLVHRALAPRGMHTIPLGDIVGFLSALVNIRPDELIRNPSARPRHYRQGGEQAVKTRSWMRYDHASRLCGSRHPHLRPDPAACRKAGRR